MPSNNDPVWFQSRVTCKKTNYEKGQPQEVQTNTNTFIQFDTSTCIRSDLNEVLERRQMQVRIEYGIE